MELRQGRWAFSYATQPDRLAGPLVRDADGVLQAQPPGRRRWPPPQPGSPPHAGGPACSPAGGSQEDAYGYAKFARLALGSNDIDMRARPHSDEEAAFLGTYVAGRSLIMDYGTLEAAPAVLLAGFEPEEESPIVFLRLRKAVRERGLTVFSLAALASDGLARLSGTLLATVPSAAGGRAAAAGLVRPGRRGAAPERLGDPGGRAAGRGARRADRRRRAGRDHRRAAGLDPAAGRGARRDRGGRLPGLLPGGRSVTDPAHRIEVARIWGVATLPSLPGRSASEILAAAADGELDALLIAGVDPDDLPDPAAALAALDATGFIVSLELRVSAVTDRADVVFPVAAMAEKAGTFVNWEGRPGTFGAALSLPAAESDLDVLGEIADAMDVHLGLPGAAAARAELVALGTAVAGVPATGTAGGRLPRRAAPPGRARLYCPPGTIFSTPGGCRTASRTWPGRPHRRRRDVRGDRGRVRGRWR